MIGEFGTASAVAERPQAIEPIHESTRVSNRQSADVLVVDDDAASLFAVSSLLAAPNQRLFLARSGEEALRLVLDRDFAVIVLDVRMDGITGYETARYIRERTRSAHTPIIFLTGMGAEESDLFEGYHAGAVDYLTKPVLPHILQAKIKVFVDLYLAAEEVKRQAELLRESERREHQRVFAEQGARFEAERLRHEMHLAARIQRRLLPPAAPAGQGFDIFGDSQAADDTGGDYFDFFPVGEALGIAIGDACGHGIASALTMATMRAYVRAFSMDNTCLAKVLRSANRALAHDLDEGRFATLMLAELDLAERRLRYAGAGHPPGYVLSAAGELKTVLASQGPALGMLPDYEFTEYRQRLETGDVVLFVTDGITEAANSRGELFGIERALGVVGNNLSRPAREICRELYSAARQFAGRDALEDDATVIVVRASPPRAQE